MIHDRFHWRVSTRDAKLHCVGSPQYCPFDESKTFQVVEPRHWDNLANRCIPGSPTDHTETPKVLSCVLEGLEDAALAISRESRFRQEVPSTIADKVTEPFRVMEESKRAKVVLAITRHPRLEVVATDQGDEWF